MRPLASVDEVVALFDAFGSDTYDEDLSQLDHALQTAALALDAGAVDELVIAALLHDIGHLLDLEAGGSAGSPVIARHEEVGATALTPLFGASVTAPIARHVTAKRYLVAIEPDLVDRLSDGSRTSLARQGGPMTAEEATPFERDRWFTDACALRRWDDGGKVEGLVVPPLSAYVPLLRRIAGVQS